LRHALTGYEFGAPGWYVVDTGYRPTRRLAGPYTSRDDAAQTLAVYRRAGRLAGWTE
jgi:hypothetical protein